MWPPGIKALNLEDVDSSRFNVRSIGVSRLEVRRVALGHPDDFDRECLLEVGNPGLPSGFVRDLLHDQKTILPEYSNSLLQEFGPAFDRQEIENIYNGHTVKGIGRQSRY